MKKIFFLAIACITFSFAQAQQQDTLYQFNELTHNFGDIPQGIPATYVFEVTNVGTTPLTIINVQASCGCTSPDWTKDPITPGAKGIVKATYNAAAVGHFSKNLKITTDSTPDVVTLFITGTVIAPQASENK